MVPKSVIYLSGLSMVICVPMIALSMVNFGLLSIWLNATVAFLVLIHHLAFLIVTWVNRKQNPPKVIIAEEEGDDTLVEEPSIAIHMGNIFSLAFLAIINAIAFSIMVDITTRGAISSTLPAERIGSYKWNIKVEIGQTSVLGFELVVLSTILAICGFGRRRYNIAKEMQEDEMDYGLA